MKVYQKLAQLLTAIENCRNSGNDEWLTKHTLTLDSLVKDYLPRGAGFDLGTQLDEDNSNPERLVFHTSFHHMNDVGMYDGWSTHSVVVTPSLGFGFELRVTGRDRNDIKNYIFGLFEHALNTDYLITAKQGEAA